MPSTLFYSPGELCRYRRGRTAPRNLSPLPLSGTNHPHVHPGKSSHAFLARAAVKERPCRTVPRQLTDSTQSRSDVRSELSPLPRPYLRGSLRLRGLICLETVHACLIRGKEKDTLIGRTLPGNKAGRNGRSACKTGRRRRRVSEAPPRGSGISRRAWLTRCLRGSVKDIHSDKGTRRRLCLRCR